jgi:hypothetical protein
MTYPQPPYASPYDAPKPPRLRGRKPLMVALITFVIAVVLLVVGGVILGTKSLGKVNSFQRVSITNGAATGTVDFNGTGKWVAYYEASDVTNSISQLPAIQLAITSASGQAVSGVPYGNRSDGQVKKLTYGYNSHHGVAMFQFHISATGAYQVQAQSATPLPAGADIAFGRDIAGGTIAGALLILAGIAFLIAAIVLLIVGLVKRSRHKKELARGTYYGAGPGQPYGAQPYAGQPYGGVPAPGQPYGGQPQPSQPQPYPGQPYGAQPYGGQPPQPGQPYPGQAQPYGGQPQPGPAYGQPYPSQPEVPAPPQPDPWAAPAGGWPGQPQPSAPPAEPSQESRFGDESGSTDPDPTRPA